MRFRQHIPRVFGLFKAYNSIEGTGQRDSARDSRGGRSRSMAMVLLNQKGIALLLVMWIIIILFVIVTEFSFTMRSEMNITRNFKEDAECYYLAVAGVQLAIDELLHKFDNVYRDEEGHLILEDKDQAQGTAVNPQTGEKTVVQEEIPPPIRTAIPIGNGYVSYIINDEDSKLNLNQVVRVDNRPGSPYQALRQLFIDSGVEPGLQLDIIMDSILDWRDSNDEHHLNGAESDWYESHYGEQGFDSPYQAKNGPFSTVDELLMVRGITPEILYGTRLARMMYGDTLQTDPESEEEVVYEGVYKYLSTFNMGRQINENTASEELIRAMYPDTADEILQSRDARGGKYRERQVSSYYTIISTGYLPGSDTRHTIRATVWRRGSHFHAGVEVQFWKDNELEKMAEVTLPGSDSETQSPDSVP